MKKLLLKVIFLLMVLVAFGDRLNAQMSVALVASKDNTIYDDSINFSNGAGKYLFTGTGNNLGSKRALLYFDLESALPDNSVLDSAVLSLRYDKGLQISPQEVAVHVLNKSWGEAGSFGPSGEGKGAPAKAGDATWIHSQYDTDAWETPGGDFNTPASASATISKIDTVEWRGAGLTADVNGWLADDTKNHGWILIGNEGVASSSKRYISSNSGASLYRPTLTLYYHEEALSARASASFNDISSSLNAYPNPFRETLTIRYSIEQGETIQLGIYNLLGQEIRHVDKGFHSPGNYQFTWDGIDRSGKSVPSGMYYIIFVNGTDRQVL